MGMSRYNRQNPFMYLLESKENELINKTSSGVKHMIGMVSISIIAIILNIIHSLFFIKPMMVISIIIAYIVFSSFLELRSCIREIHAVDVNVMIFGDEYKDINLNNERILSMINNYNVAIGKAEHCIENIYLNDILMFVIVSVYVVLFMIKII